MRKPTKQQIEFSQSMNEQQWRLLVTLAVGGTYYLSATERSDPRVKAMHRAGLVSMGSGAANLHALWCWWATEQGVALARKHCAP